MVTIVLEILGRCVDLASLKLGPCCVDMLAWPLERLLFPGGRVKRFEGFSWTRAWVVLVYFMFCIHS